jgi:hypothetical protein
VAVPPASTVHSTAEPLSQREPEQLSSGALSPTTTPWSFTA